MFTDESYTPIYQSDGKSSAFAFMTNAYEGDSGTVYRFQNPTTGEMYFTMSAPGTAEYESLVNNNWRNRSTSMGGLPQGYMRLFPQGMTESVTVNGQLVYNPQINAITAPTNDPGLFLTVWHIYYAPSGDRVMTLRVAERNAYSPVAPADPLSASHWQENYPRGFAWFSLLADLSTGFPDDDATPFVP